MAAVLSDFARSLSVETAFTVLAVAKSLKASGKDVVELEIGDSPFNSTAAAKSTGITAIDGAFVAGDPVDLLDQNGHAVARGLVNFDARELPALLGRSTRELARELGPAYEREVIHRDDLVILAP